MKTTTILKKVEINAGKKITTDYSHAGLSTQRNINCRAIEKLIAEGGTNLVRYLGWLDLLNDTNIILLSPRHHYYYGLNELKCISTLIVLKKLNLFKDIDSFLNDLHNDLSPGTNFIGFFSDSYKQSRSDPISTIYKRIINFLDSKIDIAFDRESVCKLLESHGFQVVDMTMIKGLIYFRTQNVF